jgi:hypothetical protein
MDVDFIIDEGPDTVNMQADAAATLQALGPKFAQEFPELAIELSPLESRVKTMMLSKIKAKQSAPLQPDPTKMAELQAKGQIEQAKQAADQRGEQAKSMLENQKESAAQMLEWRKAQLQALTQIEVARIGAKTDQDSESLAARLEMILGFANMAHEHVQNAQDRAHEQIEGAQDRAHDMNLARISAAQQPAPGQ